MAKFYFLRRLLGVMVASLLFFPLTIHVYAQALPPEIRKAKRAVGFLFTQGSRDRFHAQGTAFFVGVPSKSGDKSRTFHYIVTAKHVLEDPAGRYFKRVYLRVNKKDGSSVMVPIDLEEGSVFTHPNENVDLAVIPGRPTSNEVDEVDYVWIPTGMIASRSRHKVLFREGTRVAFWGLFVPHIGNQRNFPVIRFGKVAMLSEELIKAGGRLQRLHLIDALATKGNSGGPVFFYGTDPRVVVLAGVITLKFWESASRTEEARTAAGIAGVVPASLLAEILNSDELRRKRLRTR